MSVTELFPYGFRVPPSVGLEGQVIREASQKFMNADLAKSGLVAADIKAYACSLELRRYAKFATAGYMIPYYDIQGNVLADKITGVSGPGRMWRIRLYHPPTLPKETLRKLSKYTQPAREELGEATGYPYLYPIAAPDYPETVFIVEGEKKAAALSLRFNVRTIGIGGCSAWGHWDPEHDGELHTISVDFLEEYGIKQAVILPDGDIRKPHISRSYKGLYDALVAVGQEVVIKNTALLIPDKVDDWLVANPQAGLEVVEEWEDFPLDEMLENPATVAVRYSLMPGTQRNEVIAPNESNVRKLLENHPAYKGTIRWNSDKQEMDGGSEETITETLTSMQVMFNISKLGKGTVKTCVGYVARKNEYSPLKEWLDSLVWDGVKRLATLFIRGMGAVDSPYYREVAIKSMVGAVARRYEPGCMVDYMPILKGAQGIGKSSAVRILFGKYTFELVRGGLEGDALVRALHTGNVWCASDEEVGRLSKTETNHFKGFLTRRFDPLRLLFINEIRSIPRPWVIWGTTNDHEPIPYDDSGYRRYAVVEVKQVDFKWVEGARIQLWAEAVNLYKSKGVDYSNIVGASANSEQYAMGSMMVEQVEEALEHWLKGMGKNQTVEYLGKGFYWLRINHILHSLGIQDRVISDYRKREYSSALRKLGWTKVNQMHINGKHVNGIYLYPLK